MAKKPEEKVKVMLLGGLNEIGKNMTLIEYKDQMIIIDCGIGFPDDDMLGIDLVIPDFTYVESNADKLLGVFITHGHEDHIGAVPYLLKTLNVPVFATRLAIGILQNKLMEHLLDYTPELVDVEAGDTVKVGDFQVEFIRVNHSIADACCLAVKTPVGTILHTGDFKLDLTPIDGDVMDLHRLAEIGKKGVLLMLCESTNVERPGYTPSERTVGQALDTIFAQNKDKRLVIATFSSNVHRVQQIIDKSARYGRKVVITGRSMMNIVTAASELGYMNVPEGLIVDIGEMKRYNPEQITIICTGSQGEPMSALYRMAYGEHDRVTLGNKDLVVISAHPIPGNEKLVDNIINELYRRGIAIYREENSDVHVSGHACREEIKLMHALVKPKFFMPIHGECKHLCSHRDLAVEMGMSPQNVFVSDIGKVLELGSKTAAWGGTVPAGRVLIDGKGVGDVGSIVLRDRKHLGEDGIIVIVAVLNDFDRSLGSVDIVTRGFVYVKESEELMTEMKEVAWQSLGDALGQGITDPAQLKGKLRDDVNHFIYNKTKRRPMVLPVIITV
ncbi:MAG: ribonuclease J [Ruminococcaceae bacterium]|nr:ribonuclease J [Oscillospiraceae bacterium]